MNDSLRMLALIGAASIAAPVQAAPVFLTCHMAQPDGEVFQADLQMNEEAGTVTYSFPDNGRTFTVRGFFTPAEVSFGRFTISRTDLTFKRNNEGLLGSSADKASSSGKCAIDQTQRAF